MIHHAIDKINEELALMGATSFNAFGEDVPLCVRLSESLEEEEADAPRIVAYPTTETFDFDTQRNQQLRSIRNRVTTVMIVMNGRTLEDVEIMLQHVVLAIHNTGVGSTQIQGFTWNRDTRTAQYGRKGALQITVLTPITRLPTVDAPQGTVVNLSLGIGATLTPVISTELATIQGTVHTQVIPATAWHCVAPYDRAPVFVTSDAGVPVSVTYTDRACDLTFATPVSGRAYFQET